MPVVKEIDYLASAALVPRTAKSPLHITDDVVQADNKYVSSVIEIHEEEDQMGPSLLVQSQTKSRVVHIAWFAVLLTCFLAVKVSILLLKLLIVINSFN